LSDRGVEVFVGHGADRLDTDVDVVAVSTAIPADNAEVMEARRRGLPVLRRADVLAGIAGTRRTIAVAGTHGKTTTSTLLALVLKAGGERPSWIIGGELLGAAAGAHWDEGAWLVLEADESDGTFIELGAEAVIVTNVEADHLEHYGGWDGLVSAFDSFVEQTSGPRVVCLDDTGAAALADRFTVTTYGTDKRAGYRIENPRFSRFEASFTLRAGAESVTVALPAPGLHNVRNATAALALGHRLGVPLEVGAAGVANYGGIARRFQRRGERAGITFVDDYAHLPSEVKAAVAAARGGNWDRVVAVFQPHRYSRTQQVGADFGGSFDGVDFLVLTDVYAAGEQQRDAVSGDIVRRAVMSMPDHPDLIYVEERADLASAVAGVLRSGDLCLTLGAGDVTKVADEIQAIL